MKIHVLTLFPGILQGAFSESIIGLAREKGILDINLKDLRDFCQDKHKTADDTPYGGGGGMVLKAGPVVAAVADCRLQSPASKVIYLSPQGRRLDHLKVVELAREESLILVCGRYEGLDERALSLCVDEELSVGDFVLTGGELAAGIVVDAVARLLPGVLGDENSAANDSFFHGLLDFPHYTRPAEFMGLKVPEVLMSGDHAAVALWRRRESLRQTLLKRPDLLEKAELTKEDREFLKELGWESAGAKLRGRATKQKSNKKG